jgi:hypothetical protein
VRGYRIAASQFLGDDPSPSVMASHCHKKCHWQNCLSYQLELRTPSVNARPRALRLDISGTSDREDKAPNTYVFYRKTSSL